MLKRNNDHLPRKILVTVFFVDLFATFVCSATLLFIGENQQFVTVSNIATHALIVCVLLIVAFFVFCVVEIMLNNALNTKVMQFLDTKQFEEGTAYLQKLPKIKILYDNCQRQLYYIALLNLYLDNTKEAQSNFCNVNLTSSMLEATIFVNTTMYLLLIHREHNHTQGSQFVKDNYFANIAGYKRNKQTREKISATSAVIQKILDDDLPAVRTALQDKLDIPLIKRLPSNQA